MDSCHPYRSDSYQGGYPRGYPPGGSPKHPGSGVLLEVSNATASVSGDMTQSHQRPARASSRPYAGGHWVLPSEVRLRIVSPAERSPPISNPQSQIHNRRGPCPRPGRILRPRRRGRLAPPPSRVSGSGHDRDSQRESRSVSRSVTSVRPASAWPCTRRCRTAPGRCPHSGCGRPG